MENLAILISCDEDDVKNVNRLLYTISKSELSNVPVYVIIDSKYENNFIFLSIKYHNVTILKLCDIVKQIDDVDILELDDDYDKLNIKIFYGLFYIFYTKSYDSIIVLKPFDLMINNIDTKALSERQLFYYEYKDDIMHNCDIASILLLECPIRCRFVDYSLWTYKRNIFSDMYNFLFCKFQNHFFDIIDKLNISIDQLYRIFIYMNSKYTINTIQINDICNTTNKLVNNYMNNKTYDKLAKDINNIIYDPDNSKSELAFVNNHNNICILSGNASDYIFDNNFGEYKIDGISNYSMIFSGMKCDDENNFKFSPETYGIQETSNDTSRVWFGYDISTTKKIEITISFELLVKCSKQTKFFFKMNYSTECTEILVDKNMNDFNKYEITTSINNCNDILYFSFDDKCNGTIKNFAILTKIK